MIDMRMWFILFLACLQFSCGRATDNVYMTEEDRAIFERFLTEMQDEKALPTGELMVKCARFFLDVPYVASTLEQEPEGLVVNLRELDCTTLVETTFALTRTLQSDKPTFETFCEQLQQIRYRKGVINDYTDRLHYITDWLYENQRRGFVKDMSQEIGGTELPINLSFMSTHPESYKPLKNNPEFIARIAEQEKEISGRSYYYVPEEDINKLSSGIQSGDIFAFVTTVKGLDVSHMAIAYWNGDKLTFLHASSTYKKVLVNESSLYEYLKEIKSNTGVIVMRPQHY